MAKGNIITVGIRPAWDVLCQVEGLDWGDHKTIDEQILTPAGKSLNVSKALAWMGYPSIATGLWGQEDYEDMVEALKPINCFVDIRFAAVRGHTRRNITIHDTKNDRQMHLRIKGNLANRGSLRRLQTQLDSIVDKNDIVVFAGSLPDGQQLQDVMEIIRSCESKAGKVLIDSNGQPFKTVIENKSAQFISPNTEELAELTGSNFKNETGAIIKAARKLLSLVPTILVSRGAEGLILVTEAGCWAAKYIGEQKRVVKTVGCGDHLLAGIVAGLEETGNYVDALECAIKLATAYTFGMCEDKEWWEVREEIQIEIEKVG